MENLSKPITDREQYKPGQVHGIATLYALGEMPGAPKDHLWVSKSNISAYPSKIMRSLKSITMNQKRQESADSLEHYFTSIEFKGKNKTTAARQPKNIVPELLPEQYNGAESLRKNAGLIGSLPLLIGLAALSAPKGRMGDILTECIRPNTWKPHGLEPKRGNMSNLPPVIPQLTSDAENCHPGVMVTILYDPANPEGSTKERLKRIEKGRDGPFYGPLGS